MSKEYGGMEYFGIYPDPDPYRGRFSPEKISTRVEKSERNQRIADQRKVDRKLGALQEQISVAEIAIIRAQRRERLAGVTLYVRDAVLSHSKKLITRGTYSSDGGLDYGPVLEKGGIIKR